jgi:hypothetical protein
MMSTAVEITRKELRRARGIRGRTRTLLRRIKNFASQVKAVLPEAAKAKPLELW